MVPVNKERRARWFAAIGKDPVKTHPLYCCEDHFNVRIRFICLFSNIIIKFCLNLVKISIFQLKEDAANWMKYKIMKGNLQLKKHVIPHANLIDANGEVYSILAIVYGPFTVQPKV